MIISASRRTDIPAFYSEWFLERVRAGGVRTVNPFNARQSYWISLEPEQVDVIVFWTRNPRPLLPYLKELDTRGYRYYFLMTLTGYPAQLEPKAQTVSAQVDGFRELAERVGANKVVWRYDPIVISNLTPWEWHEWNFSQLAAQLNSACHQVVVSLVDEYRKASFNRLASEQLDVWRKTTPMPLAGRRMFENMATVAADVGIKVYSCAETLDLTSWGILPGSCIDAAYINRTFGLEVSGRKDPGQRNSCGCVCSKDIGSYDTCPHGCIYCYAGRLATAERNYLRHCRDSETLLSRGEERR
ncbi:MAG TPA: DUF1848 domain-containing protein [Patescibacteria group bacterium]|nr:DUF1848 domain-containing protein [Patescibacteria group bacterium]